ncbi:DUF3489 domain-containing protein [Reyranella sp.]|uniref:DUF3489 domain-containing protein n=1 Tax=Reyranella sp. TaxID=1929291 RepID=UPI0027312823|nr:DUF3489 domain-containing protein [Reyranella sp.]MDP2373281.1 DUF3489 domain-containing protein [Reyranella sp.]
MTKQKKTAGKPAPGAKPAKRAPVGESGPKTKLGQLEAMLRRPDGATIAQLSKALDWQVHSVRGAMSGALKKKQGLKITANKEEGQERIYRIAG